MKYIKYPILILTGLMLLATACSDDDGPVKPAGNPVMDIKSSFANVHFGDNLPFTVGVNDEVSLSTLTVTLYFGEEKVAQTTLRTKENGEYAGVIPVPFHKDIPDGTATLKFVLLNTTMKSAQQEIDVPITRAQYPYLILVTANTSYPMLPAGAPNEYAVTEAFPSTDLPAYIKTPVIDSKGTEITFGWEGGAIAEGVTTNIPFTSPVGGAYSVTFNTKTYQATPFFELLLNDQKMSMVDKENYEIDIELKQGQEITVNGLADIADWWIDADYLTKEGEAGYTFVPIDGKYRISANLAMKYFKVEALTGNSPASLTENGTGAIWIIGEGIGKPSVAGNEVGWNTDKALCMAPIGNKKYQLTVVAGETVKTDNINFKFFHQKGWGGEFGADAISTNSEVIFVGNGNNGRDNGNLGITGGVTLELGVSYLFTVDVSAGLTQAILTVVKK
ncbi:MAG: DUF5125 domain-containing protein [Tannerellaceae bacterium]|jgi:hypothetical protein|nr:DUF5125 domain-containing protein [Tannerellaceae bacterium]